MRWLRTAAAIAIVVAVTGCAKTIDGQAIAPPGTDPDADVLLTEDGFGIQIGDPFAPSAIEIFTEPQCPHCADLQFFYGSEIADYLEGGDLVVTYRFLTFLDGGVDGYSHMVSNAMFLAAKPGSGASAVDIQRFIEEVYWDLNTEADDQRLADIADETGMPAGVGNQIAAGEHGIDVDAMARENQKRLESLTSNIGTPTVYDLNAKAVVDVENYDWLDEIVAAR